MKKSLVVVGILVLLLSVVANAQMEAEAEGGELIKPGDKIADFIPEITIDDEYYEDAVYYQAYAVVKKIEYVTFVVNRKVIKETWLGKREVKYEMNLTKTYKLHPSLKAVEANIWNPEAPSIQIKVLKIGKKGEIRIKVD